METLDGGVARLIAINGQPLSQEQRQDEIQRLRALEADPAIEAHRKRHELRDAERVRTIMRLLPSAFLYSYAGPGQLASGPAIHLSFNPNPDFKPPTLEARVLTGIRGDIWISPADERVVQINGVLFRPVDYGWGLLGVLDPGGKLSIIQSRTPSTGWQIASLVLQMKGKAVLIKTLRLDTTETAWDYHRVPADWHYKDAVRWLLKQ